MHYGPTLPISQEIGHMKYLLDGEDFKTGISRQADAMADDFEHFQEYRKIAADQRFLAAGRVQAAMGSPRAVTPYNCFVSGTLPDSMQGIMSKASEAAETMRLGGGIGYDFSTLRPKGDLIKSLDSKSSGPSSFMDIFNSVCKTISSAGHRRGAQMGVLRVDHPDIEEFVEAKTNEDKLTAFNISVGVTDTFMDAVKVDGMFDLVFEGRVYKTIRARPLWDKIMRATWDWAEPGVVFIDRINQKNNLWYCETIAATNPCAEQPLPPYGACLLGSFNLVKYLEQDLEQDLAGWYFNTQKFKEDIPVVVRAMDNVIDRAIYPLEQQEQEARRKRRMGLGVTGLANTLEALGHSYGSKNALVATEAIMGILRDTSYEASIELAKEKGPFPSLERDLFLKSGFAKTLPTHIRQGIMDHGIRNSHLLSIAPTGTISLYADNVSSGIEPVFSYGFDRTIMTFDGPRVERVDDYGVRELGVCGVTADKLHVNQHVDMLNAVSKYVDSACSKTCNVGDDVTWEEFKDVYFRAYEGGASGCTTFRASGKRFGVLNATYAEDVVEEEDEERDELVSDEPTACTFDPSTGRKTCE